MKKNLKTLVIFVILGALIIGFYYYVSNRDLSGSSSSKDPLVVEAKELMSKRIVTNYPQTPVEVVTLYLRINKAYYMTKLSSDEIAKLGDQALILFDSELLNYNPRDEFISRLKEDISTYRKDNRYISEYSVEKNSEVDYKSLGKRQYALVDTVIYLREGNKLTPVSQRFTLRKDDNGNWKILGCKNSSVADAS